MGGSIGSGTINIYLEHIPKGTLASIFRQAGWDKEP